MTDVFISYSRRDKDFVVRLHGALAAVQRNTWVDWEDIPATADWWKEVTGGIAQADAFVFVISPDSVRSEVCRNEIEYAISSGKRFVPLLYRTLDMDAQKIMHPAISTHNWIYFRDTDDFDAAFKLLINALDTDLSNVRAHTRLLVRANEWVTNGKNHSFLLQGDDLKNAEQWLAQAVAKKPAPTPLHAEYISASRLAATARQRTLLAGVSVALVVAVALAILSLLLFGEANTQRTIAQDQAERANNNAATATIAQGQAEQEAQRANNNAATATVAQGQAQIQATEVARERNASQSIAVAGQAQVELQGTRPERAVILALNAFRVSVTWQSERALAAAVESRLEKFTLAGHSSEVTSADWSPVFNARLLVTASNDNTARIWDYQGNLLGVLQGHTAAVTRALWSPDGRMIATSSSDGTTKIWNAADTYKQVNASLLTTLVGHRDKVVNLSWSPDSRRVATASNDGTARIWDVTTGELLFTLSGHKTAVNYAVYSPDGTRVATSSGDGTAKIWDAATGELLLDLAGHRSAVIRVVWSGDGSKVATASGDNTVRMWNATTGELLFTLLGHIRQVNRVAWSPDGSLIATASADGTAKIWDAESGTLLRTLFGHENDVTGLQWSPGGNRLITVSQDGTAKIWYTESGGELLTFRGHVGTVFSLAWSPDGQYFATAGQDNTARVWQIWRNAQALITFARRCCVERVLTDEENSQFGLPTATPAPSPTPNPATCEGLTLASRLYPGSRGRVVDTDKANDNVNVREQPTTSGSRIGQVSPGQTFQVINGPTCAEGMAWFEVIYGIGAVRGWLAEGQNDEYFVELVP